MLDLPSYRCAAQDKVVPTVDERARRGGKKQEEKQEKGKKQRRRRSTVKDPPATVGADEAPAPRKPAFESAKEQAGMLKQYAAHDRTQKKGTYSSPPASGPEGGKNKGERRREEKKRRTS
eukprot:scaffold102270_cov19-Tisochrysis_lutea.AAC.1